MIPEAFLVLTLILVFFGDFCLMKSERKNSVLSKMTAALLICQMLLMTTIAPAEAFGGMYVAGQAANVMKIILTLGTLIVVVLIGGLLLYGNIHYYNKHRETITLKTSKPLPHSIKAVLLSDLHLGYHNRRGEMHRWVDIINSEKPDVVLIAGDIIDRSIRPLKEDKMSEEFKRINAPIVACLGNHEYYAGEPNSLEFYEEAGITLLRDSSIVIDSLQIIGRDDRTNLRRKKTAQLVENIDKGKYTILLDHQPYNLEESEQNGIDFQLSGHTHHGQVWPISLITERVYECAFGPWKRGNTDYYVSSGIGIWGGKFRIGTRSEYVVATISN
jgi:predicted MPP superfamily phosphohydrolase